MLNLEVVKITFFTQRLIYLKGREMSGLILHQSRFRTHLDEKVKASKWRSRSKILSKPVKQLQKLGFRQSSCVSQYISEEPKEAIQQISKWQTAVHVREECSCLQIVQGEDRRSFNPFRYSYRILLRDQHLFDYSELQVLNLSVFKENF